MMKYTKVNEFKCALLVRKQWEVNFIKKTCYTSEN